jgi:hypothetical protein
VAYPLGKILAPGRGEACACHDLAQNRSHALPPAGPGGPGRTAPVPQARPCQNRALSRKLATMDIERINQIGNTLSDLNARTDALRGYL